MSAQPVYNEGDHPRDGDGRFATKPQSAQPVPLRVSFWEDSGTFEFPPVPRNVEHLMDFWTHVEISDTICEQVRVAYQHMLKHDARGFEFEFEKVRGLEPSLGTKHHEQWIADRDAFVADRMKGRPSEIPNWHTRAIIRATQIWYQTRNLPPENREAETARVYSTVVELPGGRRATIAQLVNYYQSHRLINFFIDPTRQHLASLSRMEAAQQG